MTTTWHRLGLTVVFHCTVGAIVLGQDTALVPGRPAERPHGAQRDGRSLPADTEEGESASTARSIGSLHVDAPLHGLAFSPDGRLLATAAEIGIRLWKVISTEPPAALEQGTITRSQAARFHGGRSFGRLVFSHDGKLLAAAEYLSNEEGEQESENIRCLIWDVASGKLLAALELEEWLTSVAFSPNGKRLAVGDARGGFGYWDIAEQTSWYRRGESPSEPPISCISFSPDSRFLAVGNDPDEGRGYLATGAHIPLPGADGTIRLIDLTTKKTVHTISFKSSQGVHTLAFAPDGKAISAAYEDGFLRKWDMALGTLVASHRLQKHPWFFTPIAFSCDGRWLAVKERTGGPVAVWDVAAARKISVVDVSLSAADVLAVSRSARRLAMANPNDEAGTVSIWHLTAQIPY